MTPHVLAPPPWTGPATAEESADRLRFAWLFPKEGPASPLNLAGVSAALDGEAGRVWIHLNATAVPAKHWLANCRHVPEPIREDLLETDERTRLEPFGDAVLGAIGDVVAGADPDP